MADDQAKKQKKNAENPMFKCENWFENRRVFYSTNDAPRPRSLGLAGTCERLWLVLRRPATSEYFPLLLTRRPIKKPKSAADVLIHVNVPINVELLYRALKARSGSGRKQFLSSAKTAAEALDLEPPFYQLIEELFDREQGRATASQGSVCDLYFGGQVFYTTTVERRPKLLEYRDDHCPALWAAVGKPQPKQLFPYLLFVLRTATERRSLPEEDVLIHVNEPIDLRLLYASLRQHALGEADFVGFVEKALPGLGVLIKPVLTMYRMQKTLEREGRGESAAEFEPAGTPSEGETTAAGETESESELEEEETKEEAGLQEEEETKEEEAGFRLFQKLLKDGAVVIPTHLTERAAALRDVQAEMWAAMLSFPEFATQPPKQEGTNRYVFGGFAALGNPASFHNEFVRKMRLFATATTCPLWKSARKHFGTKFKLEQLIDRMMFRPKGASPTKESWHRDNAPKAKAGDRLFGGFWNFDVTPQSFSFAPGSHSAEGEIPGKVGFAKEKPQNVHGRVLEVPPGSMCLFFANILHEVVGKRAKHDMFRLFLGWRLTQQTAPLYPLDFLAAQAIVRLKSGQKPPMYAKMHRCAWLPSLIRWSANFQPACVETLVGQSGEYEGKKFEIVERCMTSLSAYRLPLYDEYTAREISILKPRTSWRLPIPSVEDMGQTMQYAI